MKILTLLAAVALAIPALVSADENHEIIEKVMKEALKGDESPLNKILGEASEDATADEKKAFVELVATMKGTKAPVGDQAGYDEKVAALIAAAHAAIADDAGEAQIEALAKASNCKSCHGPHKPKKDK